MSEDDIHIDDENLDEENSAMGEDVALPEDDGGNVLRNFYADCFVQYASYVVRDRAIPDVDDGLKPVQRRILHALWEIDNGKLMKLPSAVGKVMCYHPHGEQSIGPALVVLVNKLWGKGKGYVIEGQGNYGNLYTGAEAAAPRYLECRLTNLAKEQLYNPKTTEYVPSYSGEGKEPVFLPCKLPLLLMMGAEGVAVGLSTSIFPHNFPELLEAEIAILKNKPFTLLPDFQLGGEIDASEYADGIGRVKLRAVIENGDKNTLVIRQLPWGETTESLIESIRQAVEKKRLQVKNIQNLTSQNVEIVLTLSPGADAEKTCQKSLVSRPIVLKEGRPVEIGVSQILRCNVERLLSLLKREQEIRLSELDELYHAKTLDQIFVEERIYKRIEEKETEEAVEEAIMDGFKPYLHRIRRGQITSEDVKRLLDVRIRRISRFNINRNQEELKDIEKREAEARNVLEHLTAYAIAHLKGLLKEYGKKYPRCTKVSAVPFEKVDIRAITAEDLAIRHDGEGHFVGTAVRGGEELFKCSGLDRLVFVWKDGRCRMMPPPDRFFVDEDFERVLLHDREKEFTMVYQEPNYGHFYLKRFRFGGMIQNKNYRIAPVGAKILLLQEGCPERLYMKFKRVKNQRVHQAFFEPQKVAVRGAGTLGVILTTKAIEKMSSERPSWWEASEGEEVGLF